MLCEKSRRVGPGCQEYDGGRARQPGARGAVCGARAAGRRDGARAIVGGGSEGAGSEHGRRARAVPDDGGGGIINPSSAAFDQGGTRAPAVAHGASSSCTSFRRCETDNLSLAITREHDVEEGDQAGNQWRFGDATPEDAREERGSGRPANSLTRCGRRCRGVASDARGGSDFAYFFARTPIKYVCYY